MNLLKTILTLTAKAYYDAALAGDDMQQVVAALEPLKKQCESTADIQQTWNLLDNFVALHRNGSMRYLAFDLRACFIEKVIDHYSTDILIASHESTDAAWKKLQQYFIELLIGWRTHFAHQLAEEIYYRVNFIEQDGGDLLRFARYMCQRRWVEVYTYLEGWANGEGLSATLKSHLLAMMAAIQLHYIGDATLATRYTNEAINLAPENFYPQEVMARIALEGGAIEKAKSQYESLVQRFPHEMGGWNGIGLCFERELAYDKAEHWYNTAIEISPGNTGAYLNKISLYGANETLYGREKDNLVALVAIVDFADPESKYVVRLDTGYSCQKAGDFQNAEWWFDEAIAIDPSAVEAYTAKGHLYLQKLGQIQDEPANNQYFDKTESHFLKAIQLGPTCFDGYWGMKALFQRFERFDEAIEWLNKSYAFCPMFNELVHQENAYLYERQNDWGKAISETATGAQLKQDPDYLQTQVQLVQDRMAKVAAEKFGESYEGLAFEPTPIAIECHADVCKLFLQENVNEFTPEFFEKINAFRSDMQQQFGITIPALNFRLYEWENPAYNFYTSFFETTVVAGCNILPDKRLVMADAATLGKAGLPYEPVNVQYGYMPMHWIDPADEPKALAQNIEVKDPVDLLFQHLRFYTWSKMSRFCRINDANIAEWVEQEPIPVVNAFMQLLHLLLDFKVPVTQKEQILAACKQGITDGKNMQEVAFGLMQMPQFAPVYPGNGDAFTYMAIGADISEGVKNIYGITAAGQWFTKMEPAICQELLSSIRYMGVTENTRFIAEDARMAFSLASVAQLEFPYLEFVPKQHPVYQEVNISDLPTNILSIN